MSKPHDVFDWHESFIEFVLDDHKCLLASEYRLHFKDDWYIRP